MHLQLLVAHSRAMRATTRRCPARISTLLERLTSNLRFTQGSNINCTDEPCGKLKAARSARFFLRQDKVFPWRKPGSRVLGINSYHNLLHSEKQELNL
jgi:hypothetical protein